MRCFGNGIRDEVSTIGNVINAVSNGVDAVSNGIDAVGHNEGVSHEIGYRVRWNGVQYHSEGIDNSNRIDDRLDYYRIVFFGLGIVRFFLDMSHLPTSTEHHDQAQQQAKSGC